MDSSKQSQRAVIQFLSAEGVSGTDIYNRMKNVYGTECMSRTAVFRWYSDFRHGRVSTADMPPPGQAHVVITQESIAAVNSLMRENSRITTREIADSLSVSKGTVDTILHEHLHYSKVCAQWVPKHLTEDQKCLRMGICFQHLLRYCTEGNNFLSRIVACDETWCHFFDPATKQMSMEWRHSGSPRPNKARSSIRAGKVMLTCFFLTRMAP